MTVLNILLFALLLILTIVPTVGDLIAVNHEDRIEKEPKPFLLKLFFIGLISWILAVLIENIFGQVLTVLFPGTSRTLGGSLTFPDNGTAVAYISVYAFLIGAVVEEGVKFCLLIYFTKKAKYYDCFFDGIVYAVFLSLGFAFFECLADVANELIDCITIEGLAFDEAIKKSLIVALLRAGMDVVGHLAYAALMGYYYSLSKVNEKAWMLEYQLEERGLLVRPNGKSTFRRELSLRKAFLIPALVHGAFIFAQLMTDNFPPAQTVPNKYFFFAGFTLVMGGIYALYFVILKKAHKNDDYLLNLAMKKIRRKYPAFAEMQKAAEDLP